MSGTKSHSKRLLPAAVISNLTTKGGGKMLRIRSLLIATVILVASFLPSAMTKAQAPVPQIVDERAYISSHCPSMKTDAAETKYPTGIVVHHTVGNGEGDWFKAAISQHCGESRPPYLLVIDKAGVIHQTAVFGSVTNHARDPNNTEYASVALVGNFEVEEPTQAQKTSLVYAISWLEGQGVPAVVKGHRQVAVGYTTVCPGKNLFAILPQIAAEAQGETRTPVWLPSLNLRVWSPVSPDQIASKAWGLLDGTIKALLVILIGSMVILILVLWLRTWVLNRKLNKYEKQEKKERTVVKITRFLYWWVAVALLILYLWKRIPGLKTLLIRTSEIWFIYWVEHLIYRYLRRLKVENIPLVLEIGTLIIRVLIKGAIAAYLIGYCWTYVQILREVNAEQARWTAPWQQPDGDSAMPIKYTGPLAKPPDGTVIPAIWDEVLKGVQMEGGTVKEALRLYHTTRSECTNSDTHKCVSSAGALGPYQFMPGTWPEYSQPGWDVYSYLDSTRAAYRMFKKLKLFEQTTESGFINRFCGKDGGLVWNKGTDNPEDYDGCDQARTVWRNYQASLALANGAPVAKITPLPPTNPLVNPSQLCTDTEAPCGFALPGGPSAYIKGTVANGGKGPHENGAIDWWDAARASSKDRPIDVLSMLNGTVASVGRFNNGGNGGGTTYLTITNQKGWKQTIYHCDENYVAVGDTVKWGQAVCLMGNQGQSDFTHLHLQILDPSGQPVLDQTQWWPK